MTPEIKAAIDAIQAAVKEQRDALAVRIDLLEKGEGVGELSARLVKTEEAIEKAQDDLVAANERFEATARAASLSTSEQRERDIQNSRWLVADLRSRQEHRVFNAADVEPDLERYNLYRKDYSDYLRKGVISNDLMVGGDPSGGYLVEPEMHGRIVTAVRDMSPLRRYARIESISTDRYVDSLDLNDLDIRWVGETQSRTNTDTPDIGQFEIPVHEAHAQPKATTQILEDARRNMPAWLAGKVSDRIARGEQHAFLNGDGVRRPRGIRTYGMQDGDIVVEATDGISASTITGWGENFQGRDSGAQGRVLSHPDLLIELMSLLRGRYISNAAFYMNRHVWATVRQLKNADGEYYWAPGAGANAAQSLYGTILGFPVRILDYMPSASSTADVLHGILFGDMREFYTIVDRRGLRTLRDPYTDKPYIIFDTTYRVGGDVVNFDAMKSISFKS